MVTVCRKRDHTQVVKYLLVQNGIELGNFMAVESFAFNFSIQITYFICFSTLGKVLMTVTASWFWKCLLISEKQQNAVLQGLRDRIHNF